MNKTFWIVFAVVVLAAAFYFFGGFNAPSVNAPSANLPSGQLQSSADPDIIAANLLGDTNQLTPTPSEADPSLVASSGDIVNSFDQSLDANQF